ncbi:S41 family peptidase [Nakamurella deserti]|uniref:S41 family peptidase n=1 Tax=Nakamurella deserti TaxID=2164074 RepID=UPI000DBE7A18|nr:S41 family peptidase [Nakamurella deserti]
MDDAATTGTIDSVDVLVDALDSWTARLFPDPPRGELMVAALRAEFGGDGRLLSGPAVASVEALARRFCRHLDLFFEPGGGLTPDVDPPGWPTVDPAEVRAAGGFVSQVRREPTGHGTLVLDQLAGVAAAAPFLRAAFAVLDGASGLVLDLRDNGGGDPATVGMVLDWLLGPEHVHFADVEYRDRVRQWWTPGSGVTTVPADVPVTVLVGRGTFSSAEGLAYFLQSTGRATVVGSVTRGAADHITPVVVLPSVRAHLAEAVYRDPRTGTNWEGTGVVPDVRCDDAEAPAVAHRVLRAARTPTG